MGEHEAFWIDHESDRERERGTAAGGSGPYTERVRLGIAEFEAAWGDIAPVTFACAAWRLATTPAPGLVRWHRRILSATCDRNGWDGTLTARLSLVSPLPAELTGSREWWRDRGWREWPQTFGQYLEPTERDLSRAPFLRTTLLIDAPLPLDGLPPAPDGPSGALPDIARIAVTAIVRQLNQLINPIIHRLETAESSGPS